MSAGCGSWVGVVRAAAGRGKALVAAVVPGEVQPVAPPQPHCPQGAHASAAPCRLQTAAGEGPRRVIYVYTSN